MICPYLPNTAFLQQLDILNRGIQSLHSGGLLMPQFLLDLGNKLDIA